MEILIGSVIGLLITFVALFMNTRRHKKHYEKLWKLYIEANSTTTNWEDQIEKKDIIIQQLDREVGNIELVAHQNHVQYTSALDRIAELEKHLSEEKKENKKVNSQSISTSVRTGMLVEKLAPFLDSFPYDPKNLITLGQPIDCIVFNDDMITFIEIKSGKSRLSAKQKNIKKLVEEKRIDWFEFRMKANK